MGDFNALSPQDNYDESELQEFIKQTQITKFGTDTIHFDLINELVNYGLIDSFKLFTNEFEKTVPTKYNSDVAHFMPLRLDYIFINKQLTSIVKSSKIINESSTNLLSDHYPIVLMLPDT